MQTPAVQAAQAAQVAKMGSRWSFLWGNRSAWEPVRVAVDSREASGPRPETIATLAMVQLEAAFDEKTLSASREALLDHAREGFQRALQKDPHNPTALLGLGRYYARLGERSKALEIFERYRRHYPQDKTIYTELIHTHAQWKDWEGAVRWCDAALQVDPESRSIRKTKGFCLARAGRWEEAYACFREIVPEAEARYHLARVLEHQGQREAARQQLQAAVQADPSYVAAREMLAELDGSVPSAFPPSATGLAGGSGGATSPESSSGSQEGAVHPAGFRVPVPAVPLPGRGWPVEN